MGTKSPSHRVASNVRAEMARRNQTQSSLAELVGMRQQAISRRMSGQTEFTIDELARIAAALGCPLVDLLAEVAA